MSQIKVKTPLQDNLDELSDDDFREVMESFGVELPPVPAKKKKTKTATETKNPLAELSQTNMVKELIAAVYENAHSLTQVVVDTSHPNLGIILECVTPEETSFTVTISPLRPVKVNRSWGWNTKARITNG